VHELSIAMSILEAAEAEAKRHGAVRIRRIHCRIGVLRQVDRTLLSEAFELAKTGTSAASADLEVTSVGMHLDCSGCGRASDLPTWQFECPRCGSSKVELSGGDELELTSLELEVPDDDRGSEEEHLREERSGGRAEPKSA
jgi:hydrogenase nickel incorporation protein HypA/HybF